MKYDLRHYSIVQSNQLFDHSQKKILASLKYQLPPCFINLFTNWYLQELRWVRSQTCRQHIFLHEDDFQLSHKLPGYFFDLWMDRHHKHHVGFEIPHIFGLLGRKYIEKCQHKWSPLQTKILENSFFEELIQEN